MKAFLLSCMLIKNYNLVINKRVVNKDTNLGNIYLENKYSIKSIKTKTKVT